MNMTKLPDHFFINCYGDLCDTRDKNWAEKPLRRRYCCTYEQIDTVAELKATLRAGRYTSLGGYPLFFVTSDGGCLTFATVRNEIYNIMQSIRDKCSDGWQVIACGVNYETELYDGHTGERIEAAYID